MRCNLVALILNCKRCIQRDTNINFFTSFTELWNQRRVHRQSWSVEPHWERRGDPVCLECIWRNETRVCCQLCGKKYGANAGLQTHRAKVHNVVHPLRALVTSAVCPLCNCVFANIRGAQLHVQRVCANKFTQEQIDAKIALVNVNVGQPGQLQFQAFLH